MASGGSGEFDEEFDFANCSLFDAFDERFTPIAIVRATVGTISAACCLFVISLIVLFKKYKFFTQRLILYLAVAAMIHSLSYPLARVNYYTPRPLYSPYCYFGGFFNLYTSWVEVLALSCLTINIVLNAVFDKWPEKVEYVYIAVTCLAPIIWCWIPFVNRTFSNGGAWCDIRTIEEDCSNYAFGAALRFVLWYIPLTLLFIVLFAAALLSAYTIKKRSKLWYGPFTSSQQQNELRLQREIKPMTWYPVVYVFLNIFSFINRLDVAINPNNSIIVFWYLHILTSPLRGAFLALVYMFTDQHTRRQLSSWTQFKAAVKHNWMMKSQDIAKQYDVEERDIGETMGSDYQQYAHVRPTHEIEVV